MTPSLRWARRSLICMVLLLSACASTRGLKPGTSESGYWQGKLALQVYSKPMQALNANFALQGTPLQGEMTLTSALGTTLARMQWSAQGATLQAEGRVRPFASLEELTQQLTGAALPVASFFSWLQGIDDPAPGWEVDLRDAAQGRISARHLEEVPATLKIVLEQ